MTHQITDKCIGCTVCAKKCPVGAITGELKSLHTIDPAECIDCGLCGKVCPQDAVLDEKGNQLHKRPQFDWDEPYVDRSICTGCGICVETCPMSCLEIEGPKFHGDIHTAAILTKPDECIDCRLCAKACPIDAISFDTFEYPRHHTKSFSHFRTFCRAYQGVFKVGMYAIPWGMPETLEGPGSIRKLPAWIREKGFDNVLVVTDKGLLGLGMLDSMFEEMDKAGVKYTVYDGVQPNPTDINVRDGLQLFRENNCQAIVAFGGGSPMDCAKGIGATAVKKGKTVEQLQGLFKVLHRIPTIFAVPTTAGTGSETTVAAVITNARTHHKASMNDTSLMPKFAVLDPELTAGLPPKVTSTTGMDALCHAVEAYTNNTYNSKLEKELCEKAVKLIYDNLYTAYCDGSNLEARANMQKAAFYAGRAFTRGCVGYVHAIGHTLGGLYGTPHGLAMSVILPHVMRQFGDAAHERLARLADICGIEGKNDAQKAHKFIDWIEDLKAKMDIPEKLDVIQDKDIPQIIAWAKKEANPLYPVPVVWAENDFRTLIENIRIDPPPQI